jgi:hypothetical protein
MISVNEIENKYGTETALFILLIRVYFKTAQAIEVNTYISEKQIDWVLLRKMIRVHQLRPFIYNVISKHAIQVDDEFYKQLKNNATRIAAGNLVRLNELLRIHSLLNKNNIPNIPYKGVLLSDALFNDFISRETSDIDLMIEPENFEAVYELMLANGYVTEYYYNPEYKDVFLKSDCEILFVKQTGDTQVKVEIHWAVTHRMMDVDMPVSELFGKAESKDVLGNGIKILDKESLLLVLLVHHGVNDIWRILRHVLDIALYTRQFADDINWEAIRQQSQKYNISNTTQIGFSLCKEVCGINIPDGYGIHGKQLPKVLHNMLRFPPVKREKLAFENIRQQFSMRDSAIGKISLFRAYLSTSLSPNIRDVEQYRIHPKWSFLYVFLKPFRLLVSGIKRK